MKILVIRFSSLGDIVLTTPVLRCIKQQLPESETHFLTKSGNVELLYNNPNVDKVITLQDTLHQTVKQLKKEHYDYVVDLHNSLRSRLVRLGLHTSSSVYRKENLGKWMTIVFKRNFMSERNVVQRYMQAVKPLGVSDDKGPLELYLPEELCGEAFERRVINRRVVGGLTEVPYVVIACGAQNETKRIPVDKLVLLAALIKARVLLIGDKKDSTRMRDWGASFGGNVINLCGKTSLLESAAFIRDAAAVITPDSAMMHFAAAFARPVIAVWGATTPSFGFSAYRTPHIDCVVGKLRCHPCSRMGSRRCPHKHFKCMHEQKWQQIAEMATRLASENKENITNAPEQ